MPSNHARRSLVRLVAAAGASGGLAAALATPAAGAELIQREGAIANRYIVVLNDDEATHVRGADAAARTTRRAAIAAELHRRHGGRHERVFERALNGFVSNMSEGQARAMLHDARVRFIEQDSIVSIRQTVQQNATWGLSRIDQRDLPVDSTYVYDTDGRGVNAYVIDTGILSTHGEFTGRVGAGFSAINDGRGTTDCNGHGTHVSGTIGGTTWGVAKAVTLIPVRVLDCNGSGANSGVIAGVDWVTTQKRAAPGVPAVANMSLGGSASSALDSAVGNSIAAGVVYGIAAGNSNADACTGSPSRVAAAIVVGASTNTDARASFSNFGTCVDLFAPGQSITSAWNTSNTATNTISGTSMATPHVVGAAALILGAQPALTPSQVQAAMLNAATPNKIANAGAGSPNRLLYTRGGAAPVDPAPVAAFTATCTGRSCSFDASGSTDNAPIAGYAWSFGDGATAGGVAASRTYASDGTFNVVLTVTDSVGQTGSTSRSVTVAATSTAPCTDCSSYTGTLSGTGASSYQPNNVTFALAAPGTIRGWLQGPTGSATDFDLYLLKWNGSAWTTVASALGTTSTESITYNGTAGTYRFRIYAYRGSGAFQFWMLPKQP